MATKSCCNELRKLRNDFDKLVLSATQNSSNSDCCENLKKLQKYFNYILIHIGNNNLKSRPKNHITLRKSSRKSIPSSKYKNCNMS